MPEARSWIVGYKAWSLAGNTLLAIGKILVPASTADAAMAIALRRVPGHIQHPGCIVRVRYVREKKEAQ
jgi:hypothetical protein